MSYYEVCRYLKQGWTKEWNSEQLVPYIHKGTEWVGYDDIASLTEKVSPVLYSKCGLCNDLNLKDELRYVERLWWRHVLGLMIHSTLKLFNQFYF